MLIFLDIDGVMVPAKSWKSPELMNDGFPAFSNKSVAVLQKLISSDVTIMLTTSHKSNHTLEEWKNIFKNRNIDANKIKSLLENIKNLSRKDEVLNWFNLNNVNEPFLIIDDDKSLNDLPDYLKKNLVQTSAQIGLNDNHIEIISAILGNVIKSPQ